MALLPPHQQPIRWPRGHDDREEEWRSAMATSRAEGRERELEAATSAPRRSGDLAQGHADALITRSMTAEQRQRIVSTITGLPDEEREDFVVLVQQLLTDSMAAAVRVQIISDFYEVSAYERAAFVDAVNELLSDSTEEERRLTIIEQFKYMLTEEKRALFMEAVYTLLPQDMSDQHRDSIIVALLNHFVQDLEQDIEDFSRRVADKAEEMRNLISGNESQLAKLILFWIENIDAPN